MQTLEVRRTIPSRYTETRIYVMGDVHVGSRQAALDHFKRDIDLVRQDRNSLVLFMGDMVDAIATSDKRFDAREVDPQFRKHLDRLPMAETEWVCDALKPVKKQIIGFLTGNHEEKVRRETSKMGTLYDPHYEMCRYLEAPSLDYCGWLRLHLHAKDAKDDIARTNVYSIYANHGYGSGRTAGGHVNALDQMLDACDADIALMGHRHQLQTLNKVRLTLTQRGHVQVRDRHMIAALTGSYLRIGAEGPASYAARAGYKPVPIGCVLIRLKWHSLNGAKIVAEALT